jgi:hypothetical protein
MSSIGLSETVLSKSGYQKPPGENRVIGNQSQVSGYRKPYEWIGVLETQSWESETFYRGIRNRVAKILIYHQYDSRLVKARNTILNTCI